MLKPGDRAIVINDHYVSGYEVEVTSVVLSLHGKVYYEAKYMKNKSGKSMTNEYYPLTTFPISDLQKIGSNYKNIFYLPF